MVEGVLLSDSELLDEDWEEGDLPEFMVEAEEMLPVTGLTEQSDTEIIANNPGAMEEPGAKATKKKGLKTGAFGGATKKRLVQNLLSSRKSKMSKAPVKNGEKGNREGKKAGSKP